MPVSNSIMAISIIMRLNLKLLRTKALSTTTFGMMIITKITLSIIMTLDITLFRRKTFTIT
jgi:hypothetical protein